MKEYWDGSPHALLGMMVPNFPNFYMLYGPNTNGAPIMFLHERQAEFVLGNLARMAKKSVRALEVRHDVTRAFNSVLDKRLSRKVVTQYRGPQLRLLRVGTRGDWLGRGNERVLVPDACTAAGSLRGRRPKRESAQRRW